MPRARQIVSADGCTVRTSTGARPGRLALRIGGATPNASHWKGLVQPTMIGPFETLVRSVASLKGNHWQHLGVRFDPAGRRLDHERQQSRGCGNRAGCTRNANRREYFHSRALQAWGPTSEPACSRMNARTAQGDACRAAGTQRISSPTRQVSRLRAQNSGPSPKPAARSAAVSARNALSSISSLLICAIRKRAKR